MANEFDNLDLDAVAEAIIKENGYTDRKAEITKCAVYGAKDWWEREGKTSSKEKNQRLMERSCQRHLRRYVNDRIAHRGSYEFVFLPMIIYAIISGVISYLVRYWLTDTFGEVRPAVPSIRRTTKSRRVK